MRVTHFRAGLLSLALAAVTAGPGYAQTVAGVDDVCRVIPQGPAWTIAAGGQDRSVSCQAQYVTTGADAAVVEVQVYAYPTAEEAAAAVAVVDPAESVSGLLGDSGKERVTDGLVVIEFSRGAYATRVAQISGPDHQAREAARQIDQGIVMANLPVPAAPIAQADAPTGSPTTDTGVPARPSSTSIAPEQVLFTNAAERAQFVAHVGVGPDRVLGIAREWSSAEQFDAALASSRTNLERLALASANPGELTVNEMDALSWWTINRILGSLIDRTNQPFSPSLNSSVKSLEKLGENAYRNPEVLTFLRSLSGSLIKKDLTMNGMLTLP